MHLTSVPLTAGILPRCVPLWADRVGYSGCEFERAIGSARQLLAESRARGHVILDGTCVRAFGMSTFADLPFIDRYLAAPYPQIGKRLLLDAHTPGMDVVLTMEGIARGNREGGLQLVVVNLACDSTAAGGPAVCGRLLHAFLEGHRGHRIERLVNEAFTPDAVLSMESAGLRILRRFDGSSSATGLSSVVGVMTREEAIASKGRVAADVHVRTAASAPYPCRTALPVRRTRWKDR